MNSSLFTIPNKDLSFCAHHFYSCGVNTDTSLVVDISSLWLCTMVNVMILGKAVPVLCQHGMSRSPPTRLFFGPSPLHVSNFFFHIWIDSLVFDHVLKAFLVLSLDSLISMENNERRGHPLARLFCQPNPTICLRFVFVWHLCCLLLVFI